MCTVPYHSWRNTDRPLGLPAGAFQCGCGTICEDCRHDLSGVAGDFVGSGGTEKAGQAPSSKGRPPAGICCLRSLPCRHGHCSIQFHGCLLCHVGPCNYRNGCVFIWLPQCSALAICAASVHRAGDGKAQALCAWAFRSLSESVSDIHRCGRKNPHSYAPVGYVHPARWA